MSLSINVHDDVALIEVKGNLMGGSETLELHETVKKEIEKGFNKIIIDLSKVKWMNSSGLGIIMGCLTSLRNAEGDLKLCGVTEKVKSLFMITKLITLFETYTTADEAVRAFKE